MTRIPSHMMRVLFFLSLLCCVPAMQADAADEPYTQAELEEIVGPIALYPDIVIASLLPASTASTDVVQAARWIGGQTGEFTEAPADANWDSAVEAMIQFPDVLVWMSENLDWMEMLAYAMAVQEDDVLQAIQDYRLKAQEAGNLANNDQVQVVQEKEVIYIQPAQPTVVYVPTYDPYAVIRPGYAWRPGAWGAGFAMGVAGAWAWHHIRWGHGHGRLEVTPHRYNNFTNNGTINVNIGSGKRWNASNRPAHRPSQLPSNARPKPPQKRPGGRPGSGGVKPRPERPATLPGGRPGDRPPRPGAKPPGERPTRPAGADRPKPPTERPTRPAGADRPKPPTERPTRPAGADRPTPPSKPPAGASRPAQPSRPAAKPAAKPVPSRGPADRSAMSGAASNGRSAKRASDRGRASAGKTGGTARSSGGSGGGRRR